MSFRSKMGIHEPRDVIRLTLLISVLTLFLLAAALATRETAIAVSVSGITVYGLVTMVIPPRPPGDIPPGIRFDTNPGQRSSSSKSSRPAGS